MLKKVFITAVFLSFFLLGVTAMAEHQINFLNGNIVRGELLKNALSFKTDMGVLESPIEEIKCITVRAGKHRRDGADREITVEMSDGTTLNGTFSEKTLSVKTRYGLLKINLNDIKTIVKVEKTIDRQVSAKSKSVTSAMQERERESSTFDPVGSEDIWPTWSEKSNKKNGAPESSKPIKVQSKRSASDPVNAMNVGRTGNFGIGVDLTAVNFGYGPLAKYWFTNNIGGQATLTMGMLTGYAVRAIHAFDNVILVAGEKVRPYGGIGYAVAKTKDSFMGVDVTTKGAAPLIFGGVEGRLHGWAPNWYWTGEFVLSPMKLEGTVSTKDPITNQRREDTFTSSMSTFTMGVSLVYYFK